jgi:PAS domain S-box-containing protein
MKDRKIEFGTILAMRLLKSFSIKNKLVVIILAVSIMTMATGLGLYTFYDIQNLRNDLEHDAELNARLVGEYCISPLTFQYPDEAAEVLNKLAAVPSVIAACLYNDKGQPFAVFRKNEDGAAPFPAFKETAHEFADEYLHVFHPIFYQNLKYGTIYLQVSTASLNETIDQHLRIMAFLMAGLIGLSYFLAHGLQRAISKPILHLADVATELTEKGDYTLRVQREDSDEIGALYDGFNTMVEQIHQREIERDRAMAALQESEERFRRLAVAAFEGIALSEESQIIDANQQLADMLGCNLPELIGKPVAQFVAKESMETVMRHIRSGSEEPYEHLARKADGTVFPVEVRARATPYHGKTVRVTAIRDITERKKAEEALSEQAKELARSNKDLEQFAYVASHDLQEPLRAVTGCLHILQRRYQYQLDAEADELILHAVDGAYRLQRLIEGLLAFSRVGTGGSRLQPAACEQAVDAALKNLATAIAESGAVITQDTLPTVMGDLTQLTLLFQNLIGNAIKFRRREPPPRIHVGAQLQGKECTVSVRDNGIGIDPQYFKRIFDIFQRLHTRQEYPGTGIGLAICKKVVERHGGRIWLESAPQQGSTFYFTLLNHDEQQ